MAVARQDTITW